MVNNTDWSNNIVFYWIIVFLFVLVIILLI
jgi:hypothetical protein